MHQPLTLWSTACNQEIELKTLITGATGFVGSAVLRKLLDAEFECRALIRLSSDRRNIDGLDVEICFGDLNDRDSLAAAVEGCDSLFHVAADYRIWTPDPEEMLKTNLDGTRNIMDAALYQGMERIIYTSSVAVLGINSNGVPGDENTPVELDEMVGAYKRSKFIAEAEVTKMVNTKSLPAVIVNPAAPIGPRDIKPTPTGRIVVEAARGKVPAYVDTGLNIVHVDDVADGHLLAFNKGKIGERYILGGEDLTLKMLLDSIADATNNRRPMFRIPHNLIIPIAYLAETWTRMRKQGEPFVTLDGLNMAKKKMYFSSEKAKNDLGYTPRPAEEAINDAITWFKNNGYLE